MQPKFDTIDLKINNSYASIVLNRPEKRNALNLSMINEIAEAVEYCNQYDKLHLISIESSLALMNIFSAGIDLLDLSNHITKLTVEELPDLITDIQKKYSIIANSTVPTIAIVDGLCVGAGFELILACDFRIATPNSKFALNEASFGLIPDLGGISRLVRMTNTQIAKRIVMLGERFDGDKALDFGIIDWISKDPSDKREKVLKRNQSNSALAVSHAKRLINHSLDQDLSSSLTKDGLSQLELIRSGEPMRLLQKFMTKT